MFENQGLDIDSFSQLVMQHRDEIDNNLSIMQSFIESVSDQESEFFRKDYDEISEQYNKILEDCNIAIETNANETLLLSHLNNLKLVLDYTQKAIDSVNSQNQEDGKELQMVTTGPSHSGEIIDMQNVSPIGLWWSNLPPAAKMLIKAAAAGALIWGGKVAYDKIKKTVKEDAMKELEAEIEDESEEEEVEDSPLEKLKNFKW